MKSNLLTDSHYDARSFAPDELDLLLDEGFKPADLHAMRRQAGRVVFVVHAGDYRTRSVYTLDSYETPAALSGTASFSSVSLSEVLEMVDLLSKFWGVS